MPRRAATASVIDQIERRLIAAACDKQKRGKNPTRDELAALKRHEKREEERKRWAYYETIPKKHWVEMSGRQVKVLNEQAVRYGLPIGGRVINLSLVVRAFHDFLARNKHRLAADNDPLLTGGRNSAALERYRVAQAELAELDLQERRNSMVPRDDVRLCYALIASHIRNAGETLQKTFGPDAHAILQEALDDADRALVDALGVGTKTKVKRATK